MQAINGILRFGDIWSHYNTFFGYLHEMPSIFIDFKSFINSDHNGYGNLMKKLFCEIVASQNPWTNMIAHHLRFGTLIGLALANPLFCSPIVLSAPKAIIFARKYICMHWRTKLIILNVNWEFVYHMIVDVLLKLRQMLIW